LSSSEKVAEAIMLVKHFFMSCSMSNAGAEISSSSAHQCLKDCRSFADALVCGFGWNSIVVALTAPSSDLM